MDSTNRPLRRKSKLRLAPKGNPPMSLANLTGGRRPNLT
jgi:hypothetical protein